jgi:hypothetical protein
VGVLGFHNWKCICPKYTQFTLLNTLQLYIPTNQLAQPHSHSLNKYFCKGISSPHPPRCHKVYLSLQAQWEGAEEGLEGGMRPQQVKSKKDSLSFSHQLCIFFQTHKIRTWQWGAAIGFPGIHILMLCTVYQGSNSFKHLISQPTQNQAGVSPLHISLCIEWEWVTGVMN